MLTVKNLNKTYSDGTQALKEVNLELPSGMIGLLGPNGAGKSSLMRTLACLQHADSGSITFNDIDVLNSPNTLRSVLGYLPQYFGVYPHMSCQALLEHIAVLKGLSHAEIKQQTSELLDITNLTQAANKKVSRFSGGMRQRFGIAQALLGKPQLLIMDEPTAGLDPLERERLHDVLVNVSEQKLVLLSTHIVEDIENLCHHAALINKGTITDSHSISQLINPLNDSVWTVPIDSVLPDTSVVLNKQYHFGQPSLRVFNKTSPCVDAIPVSACLQDRYFLEQSEAMA
ncbi:hypothetical protein SOPP22_00755 [Shewanella sp. OPT22]|nr:hypothetical protein SOPP22_00755 [Shewanella sp. OPT22]